ncbi:hypothetical protein PIB30_062153 [Stylosanthes scabra]|uniref:Uncharacterized protein n=1 Tax=Stylosanthes scabra TaxID=79078 RepID=A0ABU6VK04_9FABA|nr:hypothetical protein [Stylosanthes scabra]
MDKGKPKFTVTHSKIKEGETAKLKVAPSRLNEGEVGAEGVNKPGLKATSTQSQRRRCCTQETQEEEGHPSPKRMKKTVSKKLDFSHLQSTFDAIGRRVNTLPPTVGEEQSIPPDSQCVQRVRMQARIRDHSHHRKLDSIRKRNKTVQSISITRQRSSGASAQITGEQSLQNNAQVAQESIQERQQDFPLPTADTLPETETNLMDQDGPELQKGRPVLRGTTIDEFLKENGADVDLDGLCTEEHSFEQNSEEEDSMALNQNYYKYVMADIDEDEGGTKKKKTHRHTTCAEIYNRTMEEREEVTFDIGGPIGPIP